jgi:hypothetical protein
VAQFGIFDVARVAHVAAPRTVGNDVAHVGQLHILTVLGDQASDAQASGPAALAAGNPQRRAVKIGERDGASDRHGGSLPSATLFLNPRLQPRRSRELRYRPTENKHSD